MRTFAALYQARQAAYSEINARGRITIRAAFPDTGGSEHLLHNWYIAGGYRAGDSDYNARRLEAVHLRDGLVNRWHRVESWYVREMSRVQHTEHVREHADGRYHWCASCRDTARLAS